MLAGILFREEMARAVRRSIFFNRLRKSRRALSRGRDVNATANAFEKRSMGDGPPGENTLSSPLKGAPCIPVGLVDIIVLLINVIVLLVVL